VGDVMQGRRVTVVEETGGSTGLKYLSGDLFQ
jgi:hypothetical protein